MSESVEAITRMVNAYPPNLRTQDRGYLGTLASLLLTYPKSIALACTDPIKGLARDCNFLPSVANMVQWLERHVQTMRSVNNREDDIRKQFAERDERRRESKAESPEHRKAVADRIKRELAEAFATGKGAPHNVFVPTFAPQYQAMVERGGRPGVSLGDKTRTGVWVPLRWLQGRPAVKSTWRQFTGEELLAMYPARASNEDDR